MDSRCQQFTTRDIANKMLDIIEYKENVYGKKILENSCGEGDILKLVVERYIKDLLKKGFSKNRIKKGLENDIYGVEIIESTYNTCISNLNFICNEYGISNVRWNIFNKDVLKEKLDIKFDFVIGNPPYISYKNLNEDIREYIKNQFESCRLGKPDYCYAFIENAINYLASNGKMIYLIPNSIFKNVFAKKLRGLIKDDLVSIYDYSNISLFKDALTSSALIYIKKNSKETHIIYKNIDKKYNLKISKKELSGKWIFGYNDKNKDEEIIFGDLFRAGITIATLRNSIFVIDSKKKEKWNIEKKILRNAFSPRSIINGKKEYIIFPYNEEKDRVKKIGEEEFKQNYPNTYRYLLENIEELNLRKSDDKCKWYEYGRTQAISRMNSKKLIISTVITNTANVYLLSEKDIPYSGIFITAKEGQDILLAKRVLESKKFFEYAKGIGTPASGESVRITADDINKFKFSLGELS